MLTHQYLKRVTDNNLKEFIHSDKHFIEALEVIISTEEDTMKHLPTRKTKSKSVSKEELPNFFQEAKSFVNGFLKINPPPIQEIKFLIGLKKYLKFQPAYIFLPLKRYAFGQKKILKFILIVYMNIHTTYKIWEHRREIDLYFFQIKFLLKGMSCVSKDMAV